MNIRYSKMMPPREPEKSTIDKLTYIACVFHVAWRLAILAFLGWWVYRSSSISEPYENYGFFIVPTIFSILVHYFLDAFAFDFCYNRSAHAKVLRWGVQFTYFEMFVVSAFIAQSYKSSPGVLTYSALLSYLCVMVMNYSMAAADTVAHTQAEEPKCYDGRRVGGKPNPTGKPPKPPNNKPNPTGKSTSNTKAGPTDEPYWDNVTIHEQNNYRIATFNQHFHTPWEHARPRVAPFAPVISAPSGQGTSQGNTPTASRGPIGGDGIRNPDTRETARVKTPNQAPQQNAA